MICCCFCCGCLLPFLMVDMTQRGENKPNRLFVLLPRTDPEYRKSNKNDFI